MTTPAGSFLLIIRLQSSANTPGGTLEFTTFAELRRFLRENVRPQIISFPSGRPLGKSLIGSQLLEWLLIAAPSLSQWTLKLDGDTLRVLVSAGPGLKLSASPSCASNDEKDSGL